MKLVLMVKEQIFPKTMEFGLIQFFFKFKTYSIAIYIISLNLTCISMWYSYFQSYIKDGLTVSDIEIGWV